MNMISVDSSNLESVGYENGTLYIRFNSGGLYSYSNVSISVFNGLLATDSKGKYFDRNIKNIYLCHKLG